MNTSQLYHGSMAVIGGVLGLTGLSALATGTVSIPSVMLSIGGIGMVLATGYEVAVADEPTVPDDRLVWLVTIGALLTVLGSILTLLS